MISPNYADGGRPPIIAFWNVSYSTSYELTFHSRGIIFFDDPVTYTQWLLSKLLSYSYAKYTKKTCIHSFSSQKELFYANTTTNLKNMFNLNQIRHLKLCCLNFL